jgi:thiamine kinase-like enzyme
MRPARARRTVPAVHEEISPPELTQAIARLSALFGPRQGGIVPLEGGVSNRNLLVNFGGTDYVVRLPGKDTELLGIDREAERLATRRAADLGMAPKVAAMLDEPPCLVTCYVEGELLTPERLRDPPVLAEVAYALRAFHDSGLELPTRFQPYELIRQYADHVTASGTELPEAFEPAFERAGQIAAALGEHPEHRPKPTHNDLLAANFLGTRERVVLVDWEYAGMGDPFFDLGSFAANNEFGQREEERLLEAYFREAATPRRVAALRLLRFMSDLREAMWGELQGVAPKLDFDFAGYARLHFERLTQFGDDQSFARLLEEARSPD